MRKYLYLAYDLTCLCAALLIALYLRNGFPLMQAPGKPGDLSLLLYMTLGAGLVALPLMRTHTGMWRFTSAGDIANIMIAVALVVVITNSSLFLISRLQMMPRSVPPMHWALAVFIMGGSRIAIRRLFGPSRHATRRSNSKQHVIILGAGHTAELYLQFIKRIVQHEIIVEGLVDSDKTLTHRLFQKHKILGTPEQLPELIAQLRVHGIEIRQLILAHPIDDLSETERTLLRAMEASNNISLVHFANHMSPQAQLSPTRNITDFYHHVNAIPTEGYETPHGFYPYLKRMVDILVGIVLLIALLPLLLLTACFVACDVGFPLLFWQQRPGRHGRPFRLYKFRTMRRAGRHQDEDRLSHKSGDATRTSAIGKCLRRLRLDELPQLFHIISGEMSFVGPRPLLPDDQPVGGEQRLSVRPGVTGWAQIHGGDALSPKEKLLLDTWYIRHMSLWLDLRILLRTLLVIWQEDRRPVREVSST